MIFSKNYFRDYIPSVKQLRSRSGLMFCWGLIWIQTVCNGHQQTALAGRLRARVQKVLSEWRVFLVNEGRADDPYNTKSMPPSAHQLASGPMIA